MQPSFIRGSAAACSRSTEEPPHHCPVVQLSRSSPAAIHNVGADTSSALIVGLTELLEFQRPGREHKTDQVAVDGLGAGLLGLAPSEVGFIVEAEKAGLGVSDWKSLKHEDIPA